jgi:hypothetical protein
MTRKVVPLHRDVRAPSPSDEPGTRPKAIPRVVSHLPGITKEALAEACREHERLISKYEGRLTAMVAKIIHDKLPAIETWVAAIMTSSNPEDPTEPEGDLVEIAPREQALEVTQPWASIHKALRETPLPDRLDVVVEADLVVGLVSVEVEPALPVTRKQAEAVNLPTHLLFAKGDAFASVGEGPATYEDLLAAWEEHRKLVEENSDELLYKLREVAVKHGLAKCAGVVLALGHDGNALSVVTREQALKLVAEKPFLERKLKRGGDAGKLPDGRAIIAIPIVVWAKGHVSVQTREVVETA